MDVLSELLIGGLGDGDAGAAPLRGSESLRSLLYIASSYRTSNGKRGLKLLSSLVVDSL
jgi:hypothetical protein